MTLLRKGFAVAAAAVLGVGIAGVTAAEASTATLLTVCGNYIGVAESTWDWTITAPATASRGQTITVNVSMVSQVAGGDELPAGRNTASMDIGLGGASTGTVTATGLTNPYRPPGGATRFEGGTARVTLTAAGDVTFSPLRITGRLFESWYQGPFACSPKNSAPVLATTRVS